MSWNHPLCHGVWELSTAAIDCGVGPAGLGRSTVDAMITSGLDATAR